MDLINFVKVLWRRKWLILAVTVLAVVATYFITKGLPQTYKSQARLATGIIDRQHIPLDEDEKKIDNFKTQSRFSNLIELMNSRQVTNLVGYKLILHDLTSKTPFRDRRNLKEYFTTGDLSKATKAFKAKYDSFAELDVNNEEDQKLLNMLKLMGYDPVSLKKDLLIWRAQGTDYIDIEHKAEDPHLAAYTVNTVAEEFLRYYKNVKVRRSGSNVEFYESLAEKSKQDLDQKTNALRNYRLKHSVVNVDAQTQAMIGRIATLEAEREELNKQIIALGQVVSHIDNRFKGSGRSFHQKQTGAANQNYINLSNKIKKLSDKYVGGGSNNVALADSLKVLREQLTVQINQSADDVAFNPSATRQELVSKQLNSELELEAARASLASIDNELNRLNSKVYNFAAKDADVLAFQREIDVANDAYMKVLHNLTAARFAAKQEADLLRVVEAGLPADQPEPSKKMLLIAFAGVAGFVFCVVFIFLLEYIDMTIRRPSQFNKFTQLKLMGSLTALDVKDVEIESLFTKDDADTKLEIYKQSLRKLRFEIESAGSKVLLFTSTKPNEGKTFSIISIAYSLSLSDKRVLIIDTNFKNNSLTGIFSAKPTLERYLSKEITKPELITRTNLKGIDIIGCQGGNYSPSELFNHSDFKTMIEELSLHYDYIFLEGASLNKYSDSKELARFSDKIIPVFAANSAVKSSDKASLDYLRSLNGKYMGSVLNKVELENMDQ